MSIKSINEGFLKKYVTQDMLKESTKKAPADYYEGGLDESLKVNESVEDVKKFLQPLVTDKGRVRALRNDEKLPRGVKFKSSNGTSGEISFKGTDYAYAVVDGKLKVMTSADAGSNWSETLYKNESCKNVNEAKRGFIRKYKGCSIHDAGDTYVVTNKHGLNIGQSRTMSGAESIADDYVKDSGKNTISEADKAKDSSWGVYKTGGSISEKTDYFVKTGLTEEEARETAKRYNNLLSVGEKQYYRIKYTAKKVSGSATKAGLTESNKKIDLYVNGEYVCSSNRYSTAKEFIEKVKRDGKVTYASIPGNKTLVLKDTDKVTARISESKEKSINKVNEDSTGSEYLEKDLADKTSLNSIKKAYQNNDLTIIKRGNSYYFERCPDTIYNAVKREIKKFYPDLKFLYDESCKKVNESTVRRQIDLLYSSNGFKGKRFGLKVASPLNIYDELKYFIKQDGESAVQRSYRVNVTPCKPEDIYKNSITVAEFIKRYENGEFTSQTAGKNDTNLKEAFGDTDEETKIAELAKYLDIDVEDISNVGGQEFETPDGSYLVCDEDEARELAENYISETIDDMGLEAFSENFQEWIISNALDTEWFDEAMRESYESYVDDIESESDSTYDNRLIQEMYDADILTDDDFVADGDDIDYTQLKEDVDIDSKKSDFVDYLCGQQGDPVEWYRDNFGEKELTDTIKSYDNILDRDAIVDECITWDGVSHFIATYDGDEIELGNNLYAYRTN